MALPPGVVAKTVQIGVGTFFDGTIVSGRATISAPVNVLHTTTNRPLYSSDMTRSFSDGQVSFDLCPTDADGLNRKDWAYKLRLEISGAATQPEVLYFLLPTDGPNVVDLDGLVSVPSSAGIPISVEALTADTLDPYTAGFLADPNSQTRQALDALDLGTGGGGGGGGLDAAAFAPINGARPGNLFVSLGDSITAGGDDMTYQAFATSWPNLASVISKQQLQLGYNAGIPGNTTAQMLARFDTDVTPHLPTVVSLLCGTNDVGVTPFDTWATSVRAIVAKIRAIGAVPVLCTVPPSNTASKQADVGRFNGYIKRYAVLNGLTVLDFYTLLADPANANYKAAYLNDGIHPNAAGYRDMAQLTTDALVPLLPASSPMLATDDVSSLSAITAGCFTAGSGSTLPTGWIDNAGVPSGSALSYINDFGVPGKLVTITQTDSAGIRQLAYSSYIGQTTLSSSVAAGATSLTIPIRADYGGVLFIGSGSTFEIAKIASSSGGGPQTETLVQPLQYAHEAGEPVIANGIPGDVMIFSGRVTSDGGVPVYIDTSMPGASYSPIPYNGVTAPITRGVFHMRFTIPPGTNGAVSYRLWVGAGTGTTSFGQVGVFNATRLGI